jgi:hypothetical protein
MSLTPEEALVQGFLVSQGCTVERIPEATAEGVQRPDFLVDSLYVVELKSRGDQKFAELLTSAIPGEKRLSIGYRNKISSIVEEGAEQLDSWGEAQDKFRILWFLITDSVFEKLIARQIVWTLYGLTELEGYTREDEWYSAGCFYFTYSEFYKHRQIDAVFIQTSDGNVLCINEFSSQYERFRSSEFHRLAKCEGWLIWDPPQMVKEGKCFSLADVDFSRSDPDAVLDHIARKYNLRQVDSYEFHLVNYPLDAKPSQR